MFTMKTSAISILLAILVAVAHTAPVATPQAPTCNPNPHGRSCTAILYGAAGQSQEINIPINYMVVATGRFLLIWAQLFLLSTNPGLRPLFSHHSVTTELTWLTPVFAAGVSFSVSTAFNTDTSNYEYITLYGSGGSTTQIPPDTTVAIGPPQPQVSAFCQIECPSSWNKGDNIQGAIW